MNGLRGIDRQRVNAQIELLNRITRGGEIGIDLALRERQALAARVDGKRGAFIRWMKTQKYTKEQIASELLRFDMLLNALRQDPTKPIPSGLLTALEGI